ncbi:MAG: hypothetical protein JWO87_702, partial [Phycisphaerales bacterium]|nr:hypothetical protein [Phycisphaerales bacterium]
TFYVFTFSFSVLPSVSIGLHLWQ